MSVQFGNAQRRIMYSLPAPRGTDMLRTVLRHFSRSSDHPLLVKERIPTVFNRLTTEQRNPESEFVDELSSLGIVELMNREDQSITTAVGKEKAFSGGLASYRVADTNWEIGAKYGALNIEVPALFIAGEFDPVMATVDDALLARMKQRVTDLRDIKIIPDAGHFVQLEKAEETSAAIIDFINDI